MNETKTIPSAADTLRSAAAVLLETATELEQSDTTIPVRYYRRTDGGPFSHVLTVRHMLRQGIELDDPHYERVYVTPVN